MNIKKGLIFLTSLLLIISTMMGNQLANAQIHNQNETVYTDEFEVSPGVYHKSIELKEGDSINSLHIMEVDPQNSQVQIAPYTSQNEVYGLETVGRTINEKIEQGDQVVGAVNGDFFSSVGVPSGLQIVDGEIFTSPKKIKALMAIFPDNSVLLEDSIEMTAEVSLQTGEKLEIDMVNRSRVATHNNTLFLFNDRFGDSVKTPEGGIEIVIDVGEEDDRFIAGKTIQGNVESIQETADTKLERGKLVLSAVGTKAEWLMTHVENGMEINVDINFTKDINQAKHVLSGNSTLGTVLLKDGEVWEELLEDNKKNTDKHPRTMLATKDEKIFMVAIDGRQPGHSDGMSLQEAAMYLKSLGMENAINIDGGGSTTYYVRKPGDHKPSLENSPSDGHERPVGNSLLVISKATQSERVEGIRLNPSTDLNIVSGSQIRLQAKAYDSSINPVTIEPKSFQWSLDGDVGKIDRSGLFVAETGNKQGQITVTKDNVETTKKITVTDQVSELEISPTSFVIEPGQSQELSITAYSQTGESLLTSPNVLEWSVEGDIGKVNEDGVFKAGDKKANGKIIAEYQGVRIESIVEVGTSPIIEAFEEESHIQSHEVRTVPNSVNMTLVTDPEYVLFGERAAQLTYDFTGTAGTSAAYIQFLDDQGSLGKEITGEPKRLGVWVNGDRKFHHLRLGITDGNGNDALWNMTTIGGVNWKGWKYVYATVPEDTVFPLKVRYFALEEKNKHNKTAGTLYFDQFEADYSNPEQQPNIEITLNNLIQSGDIQEPLANQLKNKLKQVNHHVNKGSTQQANKFLNDFLDSVNNPNNEQKISKEAKRTLNHEMDQINQF